MFGRKRSDRVGGRNGSIEFGSDSAGIESEIDAWRQVDRPLIGEILVDRGTITQEELETGLLRQHTEGGRLGDVLVDLGFATPHQVAIGLADQFGIPLADLRNRAPENTALDLVGEALARKYGVIPLVIEDDRVYLATSEPLDADAIRELTARCDRIGLLIGTRQEIDRLLDQSYTVLRSAAEHIQAFELADLDDQEEEETDNLAVDENAPIVQVVNRILTQGVRNRASDIHIEPQEHNVRIRYRIDGAMTEVLDLPVRMGPPISSRIKVLAELNIVERRRVQDGQFSVTIDHRPIDVRTSCVGTVHGEKIVLRLLDKTKSLISLNDLGFSPSIVDPYLEIVKAPLGMLLCTGPTGSGKTTTLYATLQEVTDPTRNVVTIEDPVEYQFPGVSQMQVSESAMSFAEGLRGILRQDPDVILVGEIRDAETARIATQAALTGHFVLSSLHAVDAVAAVHRFVDMGIEPFLVASAISGVVGQRLLRKICDECREVYEPSAEQRRLVELFAPEVPDEWTVGAGCNVCAGTGYRGRVGVYELLKITDPIREHIMSKASHAIIRATAVEEGMVSMQDEAFRLVSEGVTTVNDVLRSVYAPNVDLDSDADGMAEAEAESESEAKSSVTSISRASVEVVA